MEKPQKKLFNAIICFGYFTKTNMQNKNILKKNTLYLILYVWILLVSDRNSLSYIIITIS